MTQPEDDILLSLLRERWISYEGRDLEEIEGWLIGVACAIERKRGRPFKEMDDLITELRASTPPAGSWKELLQ